VWTEVIETKDALVDKTTGAAKDGAQRILADLKERAVANPAAAVAIGAGLAWRLVHRPPIATLLVGMGLIGLLRTSPSQASSPRNGGAADDHSHLQHRNDNDASLAEQTAKIADVAKQKCKIGACRPTIRRAKPRRRLLTRLRWWRTERPMRYAMPGTLRAIALNMSLTKPRQWRAKHHVGCTPQSQTALIGTPIC
jgi:hypothetical protein